LNSGVPVAADNRSDLGGTRQDLIIIAPDRVPLRDLVDRFPDLTARYEIRLDRRWRERRSVAPESQGEERRRHDRRQLDISERLRKDGWVLIPAAQRSPS
jgi:hypothetical protein